MEIGQSPPVHGGSVDVGAEVAVGSGVNVGVIVGVNVLVGNGVNVAVAVAVGVDVDGTNKEEPHPVSERMSNKKNMSFKTIFMASSLA